MTEQQSGRSPRERAAALLTGHLDKLRREEQLALKAISRGAPTDRALVLLAHLEAIVEEGRKFDPSRLVFTLRHAEQLLREHRVDHSGLVPLATPRKKSALSHNDAYVWTDAQQARDRYTAVLKARKRMCGDKAIRHRSLA